MDMCLRHHFIRTECVQTYFCIRHIFSLLANMTQFGDGDLDTENKNKKRSIDGFDVHPSDEPEVATSSCLLFVHSMPLFVTSIRSCTPCGSRV